MVFWLSERQASEFPVEKEGRGNTSSKGELSTKTACRELSSVEIRAGNSSSTVGKV
jgi:hypothetical protein